MTTWTFPRAGKQYGAYARIPLCRACGNPFVPPGSAGCCSVRCTQYLAIPLVLGDPLYCPQQSMMCRGCEMRFESRGINLCPDCYFKARDLSGVSNDTADRIAGQVIKVDQHPPARHDDAPIVDRAPARTLCRW